MNNILIRTHDCSREELTELQNYLEINSWDLSNLTKNNGGNIEAIESTLYDLVEEIEVIIESLPQKGDKSENCQRITMQIAINHFKQTINGLELSDLCLNQINDYNKINGVLYSDDLLQKIDEELEFRIESKENLVDNLCMWITECKTSDRELMIVDLKTIMNSEDEFFFSSTRTNEYIFSGSREFDDMCDKFFDILKKNEEK